MFYLTSTEITELVCTRISHDLIGNIGAFSNAVELVEDDPTDFTTVQPVLKTSAQILSARLKFFRLAFGLKNTTLKKTEEIQNVLQEYLNTIGNTQTPIVSTLYIQNTAIYKIVFLAVLIMADVFIKGGRIDVKESTNGLEISICSEFSLSKTKLETLEDAINGIVPNENPAQYAPVFYLQELLRDANAKLTLSFEEITALLKIS